MDTEIRHDRIERPVGIGQCFGIPLVEAMTVGCPILAANATSIPEVVGDAAELFALTPLYHLHVLRLGQANTTDAELAGLAPLQRTRSLSLRGSGASEASRSTASPLRSS